MIGVRAGNKVKSNMLSRHCYDGYLGYCLYYYGVYDARILPKKGRKEVRIEWIKGRLLLNTANGGDFGLCGFFCGDAISRIYTFSYGNDFARLMAR